MVDKFDSPAEVCEYLPNITPTLLKQMRFRGDGPPYIKVTPRKVLYRRAAVLAWLESRERTNTSAAA